MAANLSFEFQAERDECPMEECGFFTWEIASNVLYADGAIAEMFGLDQHETESGLPLEAYLARIHPEDQSGAVKVIHDTIITLLPEHQNYRVRQASGTFVSVIVLGRCFRDRNGVPSLYAGIIFPTHDQSPAASALLNHCLAAYDIAVKENNQPVIEHLLAALINLDGREKDAGNLPN
jgi:PAS domain-containing protein